MVELELNMYVCTNQSVYICCPHAVCGNVANREYSRLTIAAYSRVQQTTRPFRKGRWEVEKRWAGGGSQRNRGMLGPFHNKRPSPADVLQIEKRRHDHVPEMFENSRHENKIKTTTHTKFASCSSHFSNGSNRNVFSLSFSRERVTIFDFFSLTPRGFTSLPTQEAKYIFPGFIPISYSDCCCSR